MFEKPILIVGIIVLGVGFMISGQPSEFEKAETATDEWALDARETTLDALEMGELTFSEPSSAGFGATAGADDELLTEDVVPDALPTLPAGSPEECSEQPIIGRIQIEKIELDTPVWDTSPTALNCGPSSQDGAGWFDGEPTYIAGHRTTFGAPFNRIDQLVVGDQIVIDTLVDGEVEQTTYEIQIAGLEHGHGLVRPNQAPPDEQLNDETLLLYACHPPGSAAWRVYVTAEPVEP